MLNIDKEYKEKEKYKESKQQEEKLNSTQTLVDASKSEIVGKSDYKIFIV